MSYSLRRFRDEHDYWRIRNFIRQVFLLNQYREFSWHLARFDYWWARREEFLPSYPVEEMGFIWENSVGDIVAVLHPEHPGVIFQQVHPDFRSEALDEEMIAVAQEHFFVPHEDGKRKLYLVADQEDLLRQNILQLHGFSKFTHPKAQEHQRRRSLRAPLPAKTFPEGFCVRTLQDDEIPARGLAAWKIGQVEDPPNEFYAWQWLLKVYQAPLYRRNLDLVAVTPEDEIAAFCTLWFDDVTRSGYFEPVGTVPEHRRCGLGGAVMWEAMRRMQLQGATRVYVSSYTPPAHALYTSLGFEDFDLAEPWLKIF